MSDERICLDIRSYNQVVSGCIHYGITSMLRWYNKGLSLAMRTSGQYPFLDLCGSMFGEKVRNDVVLEISSYHVYVALRRINEIFPNKVELKTTGGVGYSSFVSNAARLIAENFYMLCDQKKWSLFKKREESKIIDRVKSVVRGNVSRYSIESAFDEPSFIDGLGTPQSLQTLYGHIMDALPDTVDAETRQQFAVGVVYDSLRLAGHVRTTDYNDCKKYVPELDFYQLVEDPEDASMDPIWCESSEEKQQRREVYSRSLRYGVCKVRDLCDKSIKNADGSDAFFLTKDAVLREVYAYASTALRMCAASGKCVCDDVELKRALAQLNKDGFSDKRFVTYVNSPNKDAIVDYLMTEKSEDLIIFGNYMLYALVHGENAVDNAFMFSGVMDVFEIHEVANAKECFMNAVTVVYDELIDRAEGVI